MWKKSKNFILKAVNLLFDVLVVLKIDGFVCLDVGQQHIRFRRHCGNVHLKAPPESIAGAANQVLIWLLLLLGDGMPQLFHFWGRGSLDLLLQNAQTLQSSRLRFSEYGGQHSFDQ